MSPVSVTEGLRLWRAIIRGLPPLLPLDLDGMASETLLCLARDPHINPLFLDRMARLHWENRELIQAILRHPQLPPDTIRFLSQAGEGLLEGAFDLTTADTALALRGIGPKPSRTRLKSLWHEVQAMNMAERKRLASRGGKVARSLLIRDPVKEVALAVLQNPRVGEDEVERIARYKDVHEDVLRVIGKKREWCRHYGVVAALVRNPHTPVGTSTALMRVLQSRDIESLAKNRNVSEAVRAHARRLMERKKG